MKKKINQGVLLMGLCIITAFAQNVSAQNLSWAKGMGNIGYNEGIAIAVDASENVYTTGSFSGTIDFDPGTGTTNLTSLGSDIYIQKLDISGNLVWVKQIGGTSPNNRGYSIAVDQSGNVYTTGTFSLLVDFDPGVGTTNLSGGSMADIFVLKLDASGNFVWAGRMGGAYIDKGSSIALDSIGNVYTTGSFTNTADFNPGPGIFNLNSPGLDNDIYIQKLDSAGNFIWAKSMGSASDDHGSAIAVDNSGNIFSTGIFKGTVDFDPGAGTSNILSSGGHDIYVQKIDAAGNLLWVKTMGGSNNDYVQGIAIDNLGHIITTGRFTDIVDFDPSTNTSNLNTSGSSDYDFFIQKLDAAGNFVWARSVGGTENDFSMAVAVDNTGNIYTTGYYSGTPDFDPGTGVLNFTPAGGTYDSDIFLLKLSPSGDFVQAGSIGGTQADHGSGLAIDNSGNIYATGYFSTTVDFDPSVNSFNLTSVGGTDIFIAKWYQLPTGIENSSSIESVLIFPNPATDKLTIQWADFSTENTSWLNILNVHGQVIMQTPIASKLSTVKLDDISTGIYFYQLQNEIGILKTGKLIVE